MITRHLLFLAFRDRFPEKYHKFWIKSASSIQVAIFYTMSGATTGSPSVECYLTRELSIRFIDARELANEAKITLGITGYPTKGEQRLVCTQAMRVFNNRPDTEKLALRRLNSDLTEAIKSSRSASAKSLEFSETSETSSLFGMKERKNKSWFRRSLSSD